MGCAVTQFLGLSMGCHFWNLEISGTLISKPININADSMFGWSWRQTKNCFVYKHLDPFGIDLGTPGVGKAGVKCSLTPTPQLPAGSRCQKLLATEYFTAVH